jgi:molybdate transport system substrate-binding protein
VEVAMKKSLVVTVAAVLIVGWSTRGFAEENLQIFCGAAFKKPVEEITEIFQGTTGMKVSAVYAGIGTLFSQILLTKQGDLFLAPSPDIMEKAGRKGLIVPDSVRGMAFVVPCINVQKGNPKEISGLKDLLKPGVKVAIANPETVFIGALAVEIIESALAKEERIQLRSNIVTYAEDFNKLATFLVLKQVDAIIGFHYLEGWYPDKVESIRLKPGEVYRIGASRAGVISFSKNKGAAQKFIDFLSSAESAKIFRKYHYFNSPDEAFVWLGAKKPIGGEYVLPSEWVAK